MAAKNFQYVERIMNNKGSKLLRVVGLPGAVMMGLGSIVGTGVFVSLGLAAGLTGASAVLALLLAACLAVCNGLSSAQLAASHPVSGGTYEYGYRYLHPWWGFLAGWLFVLAKSASAATAALGFAAYLKQLFDLSISNWLLALAATVSITAVTLWGLKRSNVINTIIVSITLIALVLFSFILLSEIEAKNFFPLFDGTDREDTPWASFWEASALMFVAYTGYGRIATLGEEIKNPVQNIPKAIIITLGISFLLYMMVSIAAIGSVGSGLFYQFTQEDMAPLELIAGATGHPLLAKILAVGAVTAMLGVLLNLVLGVSRVVYAMGTKHDLPSSFARIGMDNKAPIVAILATGIIIATLTLMNDVKATWSFSAFTVLFYYAITNIAALRLPEENRLYPRVFSWVGLIGCLGLSVWVESSSLLLGLGILGVGVVWRLLWLRIRR